MNKHLSGLRAKMEARDKRLRAKGNKSPNGLRFSVPASPPAAWPGNRKAKPGPVGQPRSYTPNAPRTPALNRWTGEPHEHAREIARRSRQAARLDAQ